LTSLQQVTWSHSENLSPKYNPPNKTILPFDVRDEKNWCFRCHAPNLKLGHKCKENKFYPCEVHSDNNKEVSNSSPFDVDLENSNKESKNTRVSNYQNSTQPQNLKVLGYIKNTRVTMLIDSGSSHNFNYAKIEKQLNMFFYSSSDIQVAILGNKTT
jgi:hypothetical protein